VSPLRVSDPIERAARLRSLRIAAAILCGPRARELVIALREAERDPEGIHRVDRLIDSLRPLDRRRLLSKWAQVL
jgi:hypothetical protein